jgi:hypothetical protein
MSSKRLYLVCVLVAFSTANGLAASMPNELRGEYTFGDTSQCGYMTLDALGYRTQEDESCKVLKIQRLSGSPGEPSLFKAEFICQIDDPRKVVQSGLFAFEKVRDIWVLAMQLSVKQRWASVPPLRIFAKCEAR